MLRADCETGVDVLLDKSVVKNRDVCQGATPGVILEHSRSPADTVNYDVGGVGRAKAASLCDVEGIARAQRPKDRSQGGLAATVFSVDEGELS